ncbi:hypothetical protein KM043_002578 [Ampulex compressa]|nr:hypothetical protein KM043_002578 [Ampulex compressa]
MILVRKYRPGVIIVRPVVVAPEEASLADFRIQLTASNRAGIISVILAIDTIIRFVFDFRQRSYPLPANIRATSFGIDRGSDRRPRGFQGLTFSGCDDRLCRGTQKSGTPLSRFLSNIAASGFPRWHKARSTQRTHRTPSPSTALGRTEGPHCDTFVPPSDPRGGGPLPTAIGRLRCRALGGDPHHQRSSGTRRTASSNLEPPFQTEEVGSAHDFIATIKRASTEERGSNPDVSLGDLIGAF